MSTFDESGFKSLGTHEKAVSRAEPGALLFLLDQSGSMYQEISGNSGQKKSEALADAVNHYLEALCDVCSKNPEEVPPVRHYWDIAMIGYSISPSNIWQGKLSGKDWVSISEVSESAYRVDDREKIVPDGAGGTIEQPYKMPIWVDAEEQSMTNMQPAFAMAEGLISDWISKHPNSFPPIVLHFTDGAASDGSPDQFALGLKQLNTGDGEVLVFNLHLSENRAPTVSYPDTEAGLVDSFAKQLFQASSILPSLMLNKAKGLGFQVSEDSRGFVYNGDIADIVQFLKIGTETRQK